VPASDGRLSDLDLARMQLIDALRRDMGVDDDGITNILHLVDQVHRLRRAAFRCCEIVRYRTAKSRIASRTLP
jgi:hypothetical protein